MKAKKYLLFFLLGYCIYIAIEVTYRGYSFRLMGIAGGLSLAGIGMLEDAGLRRFPLAFQMMVSAVLITAIELYSGMFSLRVLHYRKHNTVFLKRMGMTCQAIVDICNV